MSSWSHEPLLSPSYVLTMSLSGQKFRFSSGPAFGFLDETIRFCNFQKQITFAIKSIYLLHAVLFLSRFTSSVCSDLRFSRA